MDKTYQPSKLESHWYQQWEEKGYFSPSGKGEPYCIMIPPPNVTGSLHMGHGFQESIIDALIRYHRMQGCNTLWQVGTDHAGIATQMVVERLLEREGKTRHDLGREAFIEKVWEWKAQSGGTIIQQLRRLGASPDWSRERFTMDEGFYHAVQEVFVQLYEEGLIYRGRRLVNWDPKLHTAISDLEVVSEEEKGQLWHFRYPLEDGNGELVVATTRPETMLGDTAVAVHPDDTRYQKYIGKNILLPLVNRPIPVIADAYVDMHFGTGCVKITPAHDFNDYEMGLRHDLPVINIFNDDAQINDRAPEKYRGLDRFDAREKIVADIAALGLLEKIDDHVLKVPRGDRSGVVIEPYLTSQWYVKTETLAEQAIAAVENGDIKFVPQQYENMYFSWMRDIQDWCISRQLWWGHRIPAWYDDAGNIYVGRNEEEVRKKYALDSTLKLSQDEDVLDTWFSSGLWTFGTLGWPADSEILKTFHPGSVLVTGFDIIFFWVARMIMLSLHFKKEIPFHTVYVHGLVRDSQGQKMSKSKGNVLDPIDLIDGTDLESLVQKRTRGLMHPKAAAKIEKNTRRDFPEGINAYGTDALRFTYYSLASTGRDINFDVGRIEGFRNFCNKLWNASAYVLMNTQELDRAEKESVRDGDLGLADRWIVSRLQEAIKAIRLGMDTYRLDLASQALYDFVWKDYCDWYLELTKPVLWDDNAKTSAKNATRRTLIEILETILRLAHPLMPFITEEIWQRVKARAGVTGETIMLSAYPEVDENKIDRQSLEDIEWLKNIVLGVRNIRGEMNIKPGKQIPLYFKNAAENDVRCIDENRPFLSKLAALESITVLTAGEDSPLAAVTYVGELELLVPMAGLIDKQAEIARLQKEFDKVRQERERLEGKLKNAKFVENAPTEVVNKEKLKLADSQSTAEKLLVQIQKISAL